MRVVARNDADFLLVLAQQLALHGAVVANLRFNAESGVDECRTMLRCFSTFMHNGLLSGGGIGDYVSYELGYQPFHSGRDWCVWLAWHACMLLLLPLLRRLAPLCD